MAWKHLTVVVASVLAAAAANAQTDAPRASTFTVTGTVTSASSSSLTLISQGRAASFAMNRSTRVIGKGLASDLVLREPRLANLLKAGDRVTVTWGQTASMPTAVQVRVDQRAEQ